jgi:hypothetical protein
MPPLSSDFVMKLPSLLELDPEQILGRENSETLEELVVIFDPAKAQAEPDWEFAPHGSHPRFFPLAQQPTQTVVVQSGSLGILLTPAASSQACDSSGEPVTTRRPAGFFIHFPDASILEWHPLKRIRPSELADLHFDPQCGTGRPSLPDLSLRFGRSLSAIDELPIVSFSSAAKPKPAPEEGEPSFASLFPMQVLSTQMLDLVG